MSNQMDKFRAARIEMIRYYVFFGSLAMSLNLVEDESLPHAAAVDGKNIYFNPTMTEAWKLSEVIGVLCHEVLHVILLHHLRRGARDPKKWNIACDHVINLELLEQFNVMHKRGVQPKLPAGGCADPQYKGMNAEEVYNKLPDQPEDSGGEGFDVVIDGTAGMSEEQIKTEEAKIRANVQNAAALAAKAGQMSDSLRQLVEAICEPKANWRTIIRDYLTAKAETDYNWAQPHQRMLHQYGVVYPTLDGEKLGNIVMLVDASGSCYNDQEQFCSEVSDILSAYECSLDVVYHDTKVTAVDHYESDDLPIVMRPAGFGGTDAVLAFKEVEDYDKDLIIWLTDLEVDVARIEEPTCDVIVACSRKRYFKNCPSWARLIDIS